MRCRSAVHRVDSHLEVEIMPCLGLDGLDDVDDEARPVFGLAAIPVLAVVDARAEIDRLEDRIPVFLGDVNTLPP
jgi:hypothetical protein